VSLILSSDFFQIPQKIYNQKGTMDYYIEKRFSILLNKVGTRRIKSIYFLKRGECGNGLPLISLFVPFFVYIFRDLKIPINHHQGILFNFKRLLRSSQ
jgi:hypothetical protein